MGSHAYPANGRREEKGEYLDARSFYIRMDVE